MSIRDMVDSIMADGEEDPADAAGGDDSLGGGGGGLMGEEGGDDGGNDLGGLGGLDDGGDDLGGLDDDGFGEMEGGDDGMAGGGGGNVDELEHRLDELENEVGSLSSTVNTVRNENEQISNSVEEVEENVRKLLDIYEMVTRGVNPFADEMDGMGMGGGGMEAQDGSFGLFTDDEEGGQDESVDDDIADADAEGFFDDDLVDDEPADEMGMDAGETLDEDDSDSGGGTSFEDLKDEYESGEADWDEDGETDDAADEFEDVGGEFEDIDDDGFDDAAGEFDDADEAFEDVGDGIADDEMFDETLETDEQAALAEPTSEKPVQTTDPTPETTVETADQSVETHQNGSTARSTDGKPYVATVPEGFAADLIVVEWLEFLVDEAGIRETAKALDYYESVDWISEEAADELETYLNGFEDTRRGTLMIDHHKQSLEFINQLNGGSVSGLHGITGVKR